MCVHSAASQQVDTANTACVSVYLSMYVSVSLCECYIVKVNFAC